MVEERAGRELKSLWRRGLEKSWSQYRGKGWKRAEVMVEGRAGRKLKSWWRIKLEKSWSHGGGEGWKRPVPGHSPWPPGRVATNFLSGTAHLQLLQPQYALTSLPSRVANKLKIWKGQNFFFLYSQNTQPIQNIQTINETWAELAPTMAFLDSKRLSRQLPTAGTFAVSQSVSQSRECLEEVMRKYWNSNDKSTYNVM